MTAATEVRDRPILFGGDMVRAILDGRKTQTRRVINSVSGLGPVAEFRRSDTPGYDWIMRDRRMRWNDLRNADLLARCPCGQPGDRLWVKEKWRVPGGDPLSTCVGPEDLVFWATCDQFERDMERDWRPSIHMPRWASRLLLEITAIRVEQVQDISEADAQAEGTECKSSEAWRGRGYDDAVAHGHRAHFELLWNSVAKPGQDWAANPWVWVIDFRGAKKWPKKSRR